MKKVDYPKICLETQRGTKRALTENGKEMAQMLSIAEFDGILEPASKDKESGS